MADHTLLTASGVATLDDPTAMIERICDHFVEHGVVTRTAKGGRIDSMIGNTAFSVSGGRLEIDIECPGESALFTLKSVIAEHLFFFADGKPLTLSWEGREAETIPDFREMTVVSARSLTPHMRRVTLATDEAARYADAHFHIRLLIPPTGRPPVWPKPAVDGRIDWPKGDDALTVRIYTIRAVDVARGTVDIDVVLHEGTQTPGATWSLNARAGDRVGILGPGGGGMPVARRLLLAGDETALPAIARIAAHLAPGADVRIFIEVDSADDVQPLASPATIDSVWLFRNGRKAGTSGLIEAAIRAETLHAPDNRFIWMAGETAEAAAIRNLLRKECGHDRKNHMIAAYWRRDPPGDGTTH